MENMEKNNSASRKVPPRVPSRPMSPKDPQRGKELSSQNVGLSQEIFLEKPEKADVKEDKNQSIKFGKGNGNILNEQVKKRGKKKLIIALAIVFVVIIICGGITGLVLNNQANNKKLLTPTLQVVQLEPCFN